MRRGSGWMTDLSVVIPVYNEEDNLPLLWPELRSVLEAEGLAFEVVFVDDGSRDRSAEIIRSLRESDPRVRLAPTIRTSPSGAATPPRSPPPWWSVAVPVVPGSPSSP